MRSILTGIIFCSCSIVLPAQAQSGQDAMQRMRDANKVVDEIRELQRKDQEKRKQEQEQKNKQNTQPSAIAPKTPLSAPITNDIPTIMARDYWVNASPAFVYDNTGAAIESLKFGAPVTTYGETDGLGKIDLSQEKWVKLSNLSTTQPKRIPASSTPSATASQAESLRLRIEQKDLENEVKYEAKSDLYVSEKKLYVPSDPNANYYLLEAIPLKENLSVVTKRIGPSGESYSKREIDCKTTKFRYLGDGNTISQMNAPYDVGPMRLAKKGDLYTKMSYDILREVCASQGTKKTSKIASSKTNIRKDTMKLTRYVSGSSLNYRDAPNGNVIGSLPYGAKVTVFEKSGEWWVRISKSNTPENWVHSAYLVSQKPPARQASSKSNSQTSSRLSDAECGRLRIKKITTVKTQAQFDAIERQLTRGGCNSQRDARRKQWEWVR